MSTALTKIETKLVQLDKFAEENSLTLLTDDKGAFTKAIAVANAMNQLKDMIDDDVLAAFMPLQGSALGFKTDKDTTGGYPKAVVKDVMIEATLKGAQLVGNQVNIIGGRFYATLQFFEQWFKNAAKCNVTDLRLEPSVPKITADGAIVHYKATWKLKGNADTLERDFPIRVNSGMGPDAILGKAKRKVLAAVYERVTGTIITDGEVEDGSSINIDAKVVTPVATGLDEATKAKLHELFTADAEAVNAHVRRLGWTGETGTFIDVSAKQAETMINNSAAFIEKARKAKG